MWYMSNNPKLDLHKPVLAIGNGSTSVLLPQIKTGSYVIMGYNWLDVESGRYTSNCTYGTVEEALRARVAYKLVNGVIKEES